ncbi:MAG: flagellar biosynthesis protein FlgA, partial [Pelagibaca sp.]|nr:flagellar biosynthesis protein FlgA [Pelagibaca sp.]
MRLALLLCLAAAGADAQTVVANRTVRAQDIVPADAVR